MGRRANRFNPDRVFRKLVKGTLGDEDRKFFGALAAEFKASAFYPLFLAITARERELIALNRELIQTQRPDFVLGMIHENAVIENALDALIDERRRLIEGGTEDKVEDHAEGDPDIGTANYLNKFGD